MSTKKYTKGDIVLKEGDQGSELYFITYGKVKAYKKINEELIELATFSKDDFFGEMSLFLNEPRSATVEALEDTEIIVCNKENFLVLIQESPEKAVQIFSSMASRLKESHQLIGKVLGEKKSLEIMFKHK